jgi:hypothetical protein
MNVTELRTHIGKFGLIKAGEAGYKKTLPGILKDMDTRGTIWFVDNEGFGYAFKANMIDSFEPKSFELLPPDVYWEGGRAYYKDSKKEVDLKK